MKKILFVNIGKSVLDRTVWSGTSFSLYRELVKHYRVDICNISPTCSLLARIDSGVHKRLLHETVIINFTAPFARKASSIVQRKLKEKKYELIFVIGSAAIAYLETNIPVVYFSDAVFANMIEYYWFGMKPARIREGNAIQQKALQNATISVLTSQWAKDAAVKNYDISDEKVEIVHLGSNIEVTEFIHKPHENVNLLFVGVDWERKGADIAVECVKLLNEMDSIHRYYLHLVGCKPPSEINSEHVKLYGFLNRNVPEQSKKLDELREISDIFILPTKAECAGIVFCEAAAYSLPSITFDTGGIGDYIINDVTGYRLPMSSDAEKFAKQIKTLMENSGKLEKMKLASRKLYEDDLNWNVTGQKLYDIFERLMNLNSRKSTPINHKKTAKKLDILTL